jgi:hypothetical protein
VICNLSDAQIIVDALPQKSTLHVKIMLVNTHIRIMLLAVVLASPPGTFLAQSSTSAQAGSTAMQKEAQTSLKYPNAISISTAHHLLRGRSLQVSVKASASWGSKCFKTDSSIGESVWQDEWPGCQACGTGTLVM